MKLRVGGLVPLSATDYPDQLAAVVFCQGCPWRCGYCHNPHLLPRNGRDEMPWDAVEAFLGRRRGLLDAIVFSGGEPTLHRGLADAMRAVKSMGYKVGLHTAGIYPRRLETVLPLVDWVGMDVKAPFHRYGEITGSSGSGERARQSVRLVVESGVACEFRTTVHAGLLSQQAIVEICEALVAMGARHYALQEYRPAACTADALFPAARHLPDKPLCDRLAARFDSLVIRRAAA
ncbi:MAG: anaerobic ribonucleoside-triphosphate reductase activating protein [Burkholderiales bacterium]